MTIKNQQAQRSTWWPGLLSLSMTKYLRQNSFNRVIIRAEKGFAPNSRDALKLKAAADRCRLQRFFNHSITDRLQEQ